MTDQHDHSVTESSSALKPCPNYLSPNTLLLKFWHDRNRPQCQHCPCLTFAYNGQFAEHCVTN